MTGKHSGTNREHVAIVQVDEVDAIPGGESPDRGLVDAEASLSAPAGRSPDEAALRVAPPNERAAGNRFRVERTAARQACL